MLERIKKWHVSIDTVMLAVSAGLILIMAVWGTADVLGRYLLNRPIAGTKEATQFMMGGIALFTFAYIQYLREHITVAIIRERLSGTRAAILDLVFLVLMLATFAFIAWCGALNAISSWRHWDTTHGLVEWPIGPAKMAIPIGSGLLCLRIFSQICESTAALLKRK